MKIKHLFTVTIFLLGMSARFASAMESEQRLELVCSGEITSMNWVIDADFIKLDLRLNGEEYEKRWNFSQVAGDPASISDKFVQARPQTSIIHSTPIIKTTVAGQTIFTASYDKENNISYIKTIPIAPSIVIKTSDDKIVDIVAKTRGSNTVDINATKINVRICCLSKTLLNELVGTQEQEKEILVDLTEAQFDSAWMYMRNPRFLNFFPVHKLCDCILADDVLKIQANNKNSAAEDCLSALKDKFDECETDAQKKDYFAQVERLPEIYQKELNKNDMKQSNPNQQNQAPVVTKIKSNKKVEKLPDQTEAKKKDDKRTSNAFGALTSLFTFKNCMKGLAVGGTFVGIFYLIYHSMNY